MNSTTLHIGFDDTDSPYGMCTTYLAYRAVDFLKKEGMQFLDYPKLVRFNPNIPWKTRGNGAVGISIKTQRPERIKQMIKELVTKYSDIKNGANPGIVFLEEKVPVNVKDFSRLAMWQLISRTKAKSFVKEHNLEHYFSGNGQGLVGAVGAIGYCFEDQTLELLCYRKRSMFGKKREIKTESVKIMQEKTFPYTFNSFDAKKRKIMIAPHGPDPVFCGIRGENLNSLLTAFELIETNEDLAGYMIFKSNQGTGDHLRNHLDVKTVKPYMAGTLTAYVSKEPYMEKGRHVFFSLDSMGLEIACAVYRETRMTSLAMKLRYGDKITVGGGIRKASKNHPRTLNVEFIRVLELAEILEPKNPLCDHCNKRMKSKGRGQGFECIRCGRKAIKKENCLVNRKLEKKLYIPVISAHRHLTRPKQRIGSFNQVKFEDKIPWFSIFKN